MSSSLPPNWPYSQIWEAATFRAACDDLCDTLDIDQRRLDDILEGLSWALGEDPLQFEQVNGSDAYIGAIRGFGIHPDLVVVFTYEIASNEATLHWIGAV